MTIVYSSPLLCSLRPTQPNRPSEQRLPQFQFNYHPLQTHFLSPLTREPISSIVTRGDDSDAGSPDDFMYDDDALVEFDNKKDYDFEYDPLGSSPFSDNDGDIAFVDSNSFVSTRGWDPDKVVPHKINEDEFHKICLFDCDFFIRKPPDQDNDVYDFREMYVTPPDTDVYSIPKVLSPLPEKYIRCAQSDFSCINVTEPPIDAPRDPLYKSNTEVMKVFLKKHYRNRRVGDPDFFLDFEEIYVIDSQTRSITRARVVVTIPEGRNRDRKDDLLVVRDGGDTFKIIPSSHREDAATVIQKRDWARTRAEMETHLSKLRDYEVSNWF